MKCDELKYESLGDANKTYPASTLVIRKQFVDAAIAELETKLENVQATAYVEIVDADVEIRKAKRALWIHRAIVAKKIAESYKTMVKCHPFYGSNYRKWQEVERKCRTKAEEYK